MRLVLLRYVRVQVTYRPFFFEYTQSGGKYADQLEKFVAHAREANDAAVHKADYKRWREFVLDRYSREFPQTARTTPVPEFLTAMESPSGYEWMGTVFRPVTFFPLINEQVKDLEYYQKRVVELEAKLKNCKQ